MTSRQDKVTFDELVRELTETTVLRTGGSDGHARDLLDGLRSVAERAKQAMMDQPIVAATPNQAGNEAKKRVGDAFSSAAWFGSVQPNTRQGYPDFSIAMSNGTQAYVECKTYGVGKEEDTFRSLYLSSSIKESVLADAYHIAVGFELRRVASDPGESTYVPEGYKIVDLYGVPMAIKEEWHARNIDLYDSHRVLAKG